MSLWTGLKTFAIDMRYCDQGSHGSDPAADGSHKADICKPLNRIMITHPQLVGLGNPLVSDHQNLMAQYDTDSPKPPKAQLPKPYPAAKHTLCVAQNQHVQNADGHQPLDTGSKPKTADGQITLYLYRPGPGKARYEGNPCPNFQKFLGHR